jgi:hypothetical protein
MRPRREISGSSKSCCHGGQPLVLFRYFNATPVNRCSSPQQQHRLPNFLATETRSALHPVKSAFRFVFHGYASRSCPRFESRQSWAIKFAPDPQSPNMEMFHDCARADQTILMCVRHSHYIDFLEVRRPQIRRKCQEFYAIFLNRTSVSM